MFSNRLIRELATSSDEQRLKLSEQDWHLVLEANKGFSEQPERWRGDTVWGRYLLNKVGDHRHGLNFRPCLEICSGNGFLFFSFCEIYDLNAGSFFVDLSKNQCNAFLERCKITGFPTPPIACGDIGFLPVESGSFQLVFGHSFLHHLPDVGRYLKEIHRVLKEGGQFIAFHEPGVTAPFWESFPRPLLRNVETGSLTDIWLIRPEVIRMLLEEAGFSKVEVFGSGLLANLLVTPFQVVLAKFGGPYLWNGFVRLKTWCDRVERLIPQTVRLKSAPSLAIYATK